MAQERICDVCGYPFKTTQTGARSGRIMCSPCRLKAMIAVAISNRGNKCSVCGYDKDPVALQFHHRNSEKKLFSIKAGGSRSQKIFDEEVAKCDLVCCNCHALIHRDDDKRHTGRPGVGRPKKIHVIEEILDKVLG